MSYAVVQPPFTLRFRQMSKTELKAYFDWFQGQLAGRLIELEREVKTRSGFEGWHADRSPDSLLPLGEWFAAQVETRPRTANELAEIGAASVFSLPVPSQELTTRTFSMAMDIGMYLGETLRSRHQTLAWQQPLDD